ncbi:hypothetical protein CPB84DRAFT_417724 [Gymnopilus junonius]|uniref:F-box domain-containing protein n=1 Tax=Gymnopilus junonius TaxID=109634 RepID=A0A9P5NCX7_GYMJU|nr:hypothetical protein CPB84DRAFT_417724 [Gymnopilus junonius]
MVQVESFPGSCRFCPDLRKGKLGIPCPMSNDELCAPCTKLKKLEAKILKAKKTLDDLLEQHRETRSQANSAHDFTIHRAPIEIVSMIFQLSLPIIPPGGILSVKEYERASPLVLGAVCRYWRKVAWSTPQLWSLIAIRTGHGSNMGVLVKVAREWLDRSGTLPVSIGLHISRRPEEYPEWSDSYYALCELVNEHSNRWQMLDIRVPGSLFPRFHGHWENPPLQSLRLYDLYRGAKLKFDVNNLKPSPKELVLDHVLPKSVEIEWNRLTRVTVVAVDLADCIWILRHTPHLRYYEIKDILQRSAPNGDSIVHDRLQQLVLECEHSISGIFLRSVAFPALESFHSIGQRQLPSDYISSMLIRSSSPSLKEIVIDSANVDHDNIVSIVRTVPTLQRLEIRAMRDKAPSPDALLRLLASTSITNPQDQEFLPALRFPTSITQADDLSKRLCCLLVSCVLD